MSIKRRKSWNSIFYIISRHAGVMGVNIGKEEEEENSYISK